MDERTHAQMYRQHGKVFSLRGYKYGGYTYFAVYIIYTDTK